MKINLTLEVGMETAVIVSALESQIQMFGDALKITPDQHKPAITTFHVTTQRLLNTIEQNIRELEQLNYEKKP